VGIKNRHAPRGLFLFHEPDALKVLVHIPLNGCAVHRNEAKKVRVVRRVFSVGSEEAPDLQKAKLNEILARDLFEAHAQST
jgi:hypothetical protein